LSEVQVESEASLRKGGHRRKTKTADFSVAEIFGRPKKQSLRTNGPWTPPFQKNGAWRKQSKQNRSFELKFRIVGGESGCNKP
jgi:hypothetical protein